MDYREHAAPAALAGWLECIWERRGLPGAPVRVLPDGCIDLLWLERTGTFVVGANTTAFLTVLKPGEHAVGARFRPGAAPALLGVAAEEVRDVRVPFGLELEAPADPVLEIGRALAARVGSAAPADPLVRETVSRLERPGV